VGQEDAEKRIIGPTRTRDWGGRSLCFWVESGSRGHDFCVGPDPSRKKAASRKTFKQPKRKKGGGTTAGRKKPGMIKSPRGGKGKEAPGEPTESTAERKMRRLRRPKRSCEKSKKGMLVGLRHNGRQRQMGRRGPNKTLKRSPRRKLSVRSDPELKDSARDYRTRSIVGKSKHISFTDTEKGLRPGRKR